MSLQRRWELRRADLLREGWNVFMLGGHVGPKTFRVLQPNNVVFEEYQVETVAEAWARLMAELEPPPRYPVPKEGVMLPSVGKVI